MSYEEEVPKVPRVTSELKFGMIKKMSYSEIFVSYASMCAVIKVGLGQ
jgi:hypothetical protein